jgi:hypothetical protein
MASAHAADGGPSGAPAVYLAVPQFDGPGRRWSLRSLLKHGQHLAPAAKGSAGAVRPVQIGVEQRAQGIPVTCDDRCVSLPADLVHVDIMTGAWRASVCSAKQSHRNARSCRGRCAV